MPILSQPAHVYKTADTFVGAAIEGDTLIIAETRNEEAASEGNYSRLLTVMPLVEAIAMAKAILAAQVQVQDDAWVDEQWQRHLDRQAMLDSTLEHDINMYDSYEHSVQ